MRDIPVILWMIVEITQEKNSPLIRERLYLEFLLSVSAILEEQKAKHYSERLLFDF